MEPQEQHYDIDELLENASKHFRSEEYDEAMTIYTRLLGSNKTKNTQMEPVLYSLRGLTKLHLGQYDEALDDLKEAHQMNPYNVATLVRRGTAFMKIRQYNQAYEDLKKAACLQPDNTHVREMLQELDSLISDMKESEEKIKYPLKRKVSEIVFNKEVDDEEMFLNFSQLKLIDKEVKSPRKSVLFKKAEEVHSIDNTEDQFPSKQIVLTTEEIKKLENQLEGEMEPIALEQEISSEFHLPVVSSISSTPRKSILKMHSLPLTSSFSQVQPKREVSDLPSLKLEHQSKSEVCPKRISALSIKNIEGKVIKHENNRSPSNDSDGSRKIQFGYVDDSETPKYAIPDPNLKTPVNHLKRKSSIRQTAPFIQRLSENIKFQRKQSGFSNKLKIDGKILRGGKEPSRSSSASKSLSSSHSSRSSSESPLPQIKRPQPAKPFTQLVRKESILKKAGSCLTPGLKSKRSVIFTTEDKQN